MVTNRQIRVDDDVYGSLQKMARPFEDTPNSVLRRVLGLGDEGSERADGSAGPGQDGAGPGSNGDGHRSPQEAFRRPILEAVVDLGGKAQVAAVEARRAEDEGQADAARPLEDQERRAPVAGLRALAAREARARGALGRRARLLGDHRGGASVLEEGRAMTRRGRCRPGSCCNTSFPSTT
jgi:hypothetical protein